MVSSAAFWVIAAFVYSASATSMTNILEAGHYHLRNCGQDRNYFVGRDPRQEGQGHEQRIVSLHRNEGDKFLEWTVEYNSKDGGHHLMNGHVDTDARGGHVYAVARGHDGRAWKLHRAGGDHDNNGTHGNAFVIEGDHGRGWVLHDNRHHADVEYRRLSEDGHGHEHRDEELWEFHRIDD